jgi:hypothetical protein
VAYGSEVIDGVKYLKVKDPGANKDTHVNTENWRSYKMNDDGEIGENPDPKRKVQGYGYWSPNPGKK